MKQKSSAPGAGFSYAWVVLAVIFVGQLVSFGMRASFGAYISPWESDFSVGRTVVTSISTLNLIILAVSSPFLGRLNDYLGKTIVPVVSIFLLGVCLLLTSRATQVWQVYILYGVGFSLGVTGCRDSVAGGIITNWFIEKRGLALGFLMVGSAVGQLILVPVNMFIIERYGWRTSMATLSIIIMVVVGPLFIFFLRNKPEDKGLKPYGYEEPKNDGVPGGELADEVTGGVADGMAVEVSGGIADGMADGNAGDPKGDRKPLPILGIFKIKALWAIAVTYFICGFTDVGIIQTHLIPLSEGKGIPRSYAAIAISVIAIVNIVASLVTGHISDHYSRKRALAVMYAFRAVTYVFLILLRLPALLLIFAAAFGMVEMATAAPTNSLAIQMFDKYSVGAVIGIIAVCHQLGGAAGSWLPGLLYDITGTYTIALALAAVLLLAGALTVLQVPEPAKLKPEKQL